MKPTTFFAVLFLATTAFGVISSKMHQSNPSKTGLETHFLVQMNCLGANRTTYWDISCTSTSQNIITKVGGDDGITSSVKGIPGAIAVATGTLDMADDAFVEFTNLTFGTHLQKPHSLTVKRVAGHTTTIMDRDYMGATFQIVSGVGAFEGAEGYVSGIFNLEAPSTFMTGYWDASGVIVVPSTN